MLGNFRTMSIHLLDRGQVDIENFENVIKLDMQSTYNTTTLYKRDFHFHFLIFSVLFFHPRIEHRPSRDVTLSSQLIRFLVKPRVVSAVKKCKMTEEFEIIPPKRVKVVHKLCENCDPLQILSEDTFELIFQHLKNDDVIQSSYVSSSWSKYTENSPKCMEKLHLKIVIPFDEKTGEIERFQSISNDLKSARRYQNIYLHNIRDFLPQVLDILSGRNWKKVYISSRNLKSKAEFYKIIELISPRVENLSISFTWLQASAEDVDVRKFNCPHLKILDLSRCCGMLVEELSDDCSNLRELKLDFDKGTWKRQEENIRKLLKNNTKLEKLALVRCTPELIFQLEKIQQYQFKLRNFFLTTKKDSSSVLESNCMHDFLESQADNLETLRLEEWFGVQVFRLIFKMPRLRVLIIDLYDAEDTIDWESLCLTSSMSIEKLHIDGYPEKIRTHLFSAVFDALTNLRILVMDFLDNDVSISCKSMKVQ